MAGINLHNIESPELEDGPTKGELSRTLLQAVKTANFKYVELLLALGANPDYEGTNKMTPLMCAIRDAGPNIDIVHMILAASCDVNKKAKFGDTALHEAVKARSIEIVKILLDEGASVDIQTYDGITPLHMACEDGQLRIVKCFIKAGCDVNTRSHNGASALHFAAVYDHLSCVNELLQNGANPDITDRRRRTPLMYSVERHNEEVVNLLLGRKCSVDVRTDNKDTVLHTAALAGCLNCVKSLINCGSKIDACNAFEETPICHAVMSGNPDVVKYLIEQNCSLNINNRDTGRLPIHSASYYGHDECIKLLLDAGMAVDAITYDGNTPLMEAVAEGHKETVKLLIDNGANVNLCNKDLRSPIYCIDVEKPNTLEVAQLLIKANCDLSFPLPCKLENPFDVAFRTGHFTIAKLLLYAGCHTKFISPGQYAKHPLINANRDHVAWLANFSLNAKSLSEISRQAIRQDFRGSDKSPRLFEHLPLPEALKQYLRFEELDELIYEAAPRLSISQSTQMTPGQVLGNPQ